MPRRVLISSLVLSLGLLPCAVHSQTNAQSTPQANDAGDARAFSMLFRRVGEHLKRARAAVSDDDPDSQLRLTLPTLLELTGTQAESLEEAATDWASESAPVRDQLVMAIAQFQSAHKSGGSVPQPPAIKEIRSQLDSITLEYRDQLCAMMTAASCQAFEDNVRHLFNRTALPIVQGGGVSGGANR